MPRALINDQTGSFEHISVNKRLKGVLCSYPGRRIISNRSLLQFRGHTVPHVISHILFIDEHLMHRAAGPLLSRISSHSFAIEFSCNLCFANSVMNEALVYPLDCFDFLGWPENQDDAVSLNA